VAFARRADWESFPAFQDSDEVRLCVKVLVFKTVVVFPVKAESSDEDSFLLEKS
jgi:hypothetical protein